jgi:hypothetical protein
VRRRHAFEAPLPEPVEKFTPLRRTIFRRDIFLVTPKAGKRAPALIPTDRCLVRRVLRTAPRSTRLSWQMMKDIPDET